MENKELLQSVLEKAKVWLSETYDEETRSAVQKLIDSEDKTELIDSFYKDLEFWYRRAPWYYGTRYQPNEYLHGWCSNSGLEQLPEKEFRGIARN